MENGTIKYLTFLSAGRKFAIPFHDIRTVLVAENLQKIPEFPAYFAGTCIWEDRSVPVIDARARFGFEKGEYNNRSCVIICEVKIAATGKTGNVGLLTDTVAEMAEIDPEKLQPGTLGIPEPPAPEDTACIPEPDLIIVPCMTASPGGVRLGHGAGYYDRFLAAHSGKTACLCFRALMRADLPAEETDIPMDFVITD